MNISKSQLNDIMKTYLKKPAQTENRAHIKAKEAKKDEVVLSEDALKFAKLVKEASKAEDIRAEKVNELKSKINSGTYNIDGKLIADKIIEEASAEKLI